MRDVDRGAFLERALRRRGKAADEELAEGVALEIVVRAL